MRELTYEEFCKQPLQYTRGFVTEVVAMRMYRNEDLGIQKEVITRRKGRDIHSGWHDGKVHLFLDGVEGEHANSACLYEAYMRKVCGIKEEASE